MVGNDIPKPDASGKKLVFEGIRIKRLNVVIMTIMFHIWDKYRRNSNVSKVISSFIEYTQICNSSTVL